MRSSNFGAFLLGALAGGIAALLLAPRSGAETRNMIREMAEDEADKVRKKVRQARDVARRVVEEAEDLAGDVRTFVDSERRKIANPIAPKRPARVVAKRAPRTPRTPKPERGE